MRRGYLGADGRVSGSRQVVGLPSVFAPEHQHRLAHVGLEEEGQPRLWEVGELDGLVVDEAAFAVLYSDLACVSFYAQLDESQAVVLPPSLHAGSTHGGTDPVVACLL